MSKKIIKDRNWKIIRKWDILVVESVLLYKVESIKGLRKIYNFYNNPEIWVTFEDNFRKITKKEFNKLEISATK